MDKKEINWNSIRRSYFLECTQEIDGLKKVNLAPYDLFEWFKEAINKSLEQPEPLITTEQLFDEILEQPEEKACENCKYWDDISCTNVGSCWCYKLYEPKKNI